MWTEEFDVTPSRGQPTLKLTERDLWRETSRFTLIAEAIAAHMTHPSRARVTRKPAFRLARPATNQRGQRRPDQRCCLFDPETRFCPYLANAQLHHSRVFFRTIRPSVRACESPFQPVSREAPLIERRCINHNGEYHAQRCIRAAEIRRFAM